jgi:hypothetical protein
MSSDNTGERAEIQTEEERQALWDKTEQWLFSEPLWALPHALFWAVTRDRKAMAEHFAGCELAPSGDPPIPLTTVVSVLIGRGFVHADICELETAARRGAITIEGREDGEPNWKQIPWGDWAGGPSSGGLEVLEHDSGAPYAASKFGVRPRRTWTDLRVSREQVMSAFPVTEDPDRTGEPYAPSAATQPPEQDQAREPAANPLHVLIRKVADKLNTTDQPPPHAKHFRASIMTEVKQEGAVSPADSTIKEALKGTKHLRSPKRQASAAISRDQPKTAGG